MPMQLSVVIITFNEEANIGRTLASVRPLVADGKGEIIVVDSGSTDRTVEIAKSYGAKVFVRNGRRLYVRQPAIGVGRVGVEDDRALQRVNRRADRAGRFGAHPKQPDAVQELVEEIVGCHLRRPPQGLNPVVVAMRQPEEPERGMGEGGIRVGGDHRLDAHRRLGVAVHAALEIAEPGVGFGRRHGPWRRGRDGGDPFLEFEALGGERDAVDVIPQLLVELGRRGAEGVAGIRRRASGPRPLRRCIG